MSSTPTGAALEDHFTDDPKTLRQMIVELNAKIDSVSDASRDTGRAVDEILKILKRDEIEAEASDG